MLAHRPRYLFFLMFTVTLLLNVNFTILRSVRNTLAVVDLGMGAKTIPMCELFGALPCSILMTWALSRLMNRVSIHKVFLISLAAFLGFFLFFAIGLYPVLVNLRQEGEIGAGLLQVFSLLFYVMGELWKPALIVILFWGLVNQHIPLAEAKKLYAPLTLGGSIGAILAGPLVSFCTSEKIWKYFVLSGEHWTHSLILMMFVITFLGLLAGILYYRLWIYFSERSQGKSISFDHHSSLKESALLCLQVPHLRLLSWIVIADYIAYSLGEVIFLDMLKLKFPKACDYCNYMGLISSWAGILTVLSALLITPFILRRCRWVIAALATPLCLLITEGAFFIFLRAKIENTHWFGWNDTEWMGIIILLGSLQYCICRAAKYTLFDASKELAFVFMPSFQKMKGKLMIDGICARLGRGFASTLSICLISLCGGVFASSFLTGIVAIGTTVSWIFSTRKLGKLFDKDVEIVKQES